MAIQGVVRNFYKRFKFVVEIAGVAYAGFQTCGRIGVDIAEVDHHEGGSLIPNKGMGRVTVPNVELTRGATNDLDLYNWIQQCVAVGGMIEDPDHKRTVDLVQLSRAGSELVRWTLVNAYPTAWTAGEWDNNADENVIEAITLRYDYPIKGGDSAS